MPRAPRLAHRTPPTLLVVAALTLLAAAPPASAGGFDVPHQSARALGLGDVGVASHVDVTAIFSNPGALVMVPEKKHFALGVVGSGLGSSLYQGLPPGPGAGTNGEQEKVAIVAPHLFLAKPLGERLSVGLGLFTPFALHTEWQHPASFAGRRVSLEAEITAYDLNPTLSIRLTRHLGLGVGVVYRTASFEQQRRLPLALDGQLIDVASEQVDSSFDSELGWNAGLWLRTGERLSWGLAYRSAISVELDGEARLSQIATGNSQVDALVRSILPLDRDLAVVSELAFPDSLTFGVALKLSPSISLEVDAAQTGWSELQGLTLSFVGDPQLSYGVPLRLEDSRSYRAGLAIQLPSHWEWRFGYAFDETPQPDATVGPFLPDADRHTVSFGVGRDWLDLGLAYQVWDARTVVTNLDAINGRYRTHTWRVGLTVSH